MHKNVNNMPPFYQIIDHVNWLKRFLPLGLKLVQLRLKDISPSDIRKQAQEAKTLCETAQAGLVLNDYWEIAYDLRIPFVHLGQEDLHSADLSALQRAGIKWGISTHSEEELERALRAEPVYIALGPIYPTQSKKMDFPPQGLSRIQEWRRKITQPLVAIGGITCARAPSVYAAGADCICVISDVLQSPSPEARLQQWLDQVSGVRFQVVS